MSVVDILRNDAVAQKRTQLKYNLRQHKARTSALRQITNLLNDQTPLDDFAKLSWDIENEPPASDSNLENLDLVKFDESSIPFPTPTTPNNLSVSTLKPNRLSTEPSGRAQRSPGLDVVASDGTATTDSQPLPSSQPLNVTKYDTAASTPQDPSDKQAVAATYSQRASRDPDGPSVPLDDVAPPQPDEEAEFDGATQQLLDAERPQKPAKVVHLPPEDEQEERIRESEEYRRKRSEDTESTKASRSHAQGQGELASSPSSTVGAYSTATPMPPQDSPDTSPDSENGEQIQVLPPKDLRPSPEEQREKEEHDRLLAAQKEIARRQAMGNVESPDEQLKWEEREAAARDAEERTARDDVGGPEPDARDAVDDTMAEEIAEEVEQDKESEEPKINGSIEEKTSNEEGRLAPPSAVDDGDNITVTPRNKAALTIDTSNLHQKSDDPSARADQDRMATRTSSGALHQRNVSEILGRRPSQPESANRLILSPETVSPMAMRHPHDTPSAGQSTSFTNLAMRTPRRESSQSDPRDEPDNSLPFLQELAALKGAADDPDKDYLEPLFRIQAHDSPNVHTKPLGELLRSANKTASTEDHFTSIQERLDYKMLRRVYQLQNANKWSLRQMERSVEVAQPVSHMDHMMAEMKWMRKDFRAERKMKLSVCAWLAQRCAEFVAADHEERKRLQVKVKTPEAKQKADTMDVAEDSAEPDLEQSGESAAEDDMGPPTPSGEAGFPPSLVVPQDFSETLAGLQKAGKLNKALESLPKIGFSEADTKVRTVTNSKGLSQVSKFVKGKVVPQSQPRGQKRSRYDFEDEAEALENTISLKRHQTERDLEPDDLEIALFHPDNKHIRDRLHANNAFRPPSEHVMPATQFYEFRSGSQWLFEDDQKLRKLAKEYSFNWSLIADELNLPQLFKSSAERRTPWECFERWVELEQLPAEMRKTMYFKTWFQRLEQSQRAAEERYQRQVAAIQQQNGGNAQHVPLRRRTMPMRVDKRRNSRYLWLVDAMRKGARKKEQAAFKQAESQRAAAQRKTQTDNNQTRAQVMTPQEFSKKRYEHDCKQAEIVRQHRQKIMDQQKRNLEMARQQAAQQQAMQQNGGNANGANQQRPSTGPANMQMQATGQQPGQQANGQFPQQNGNVNGQQPMSQQQMQQQQGQRQSQGQMQVPTRNGHLAVPQMNAQGMAAQAQMRAPSMNGQMPDAAQMQRYAQQQAQVQARQQQQFSNQQGYGAMQSPSNGVGMSAHQQMQSSQAMLANIMTQQAQQQQQSSNMNQSSGMSPSMPPPPNPHQQQNGAGGQLSSGHIPILNQIRAKLRAQYPNYTDEQINAAATQHLRDSSQSTTQARQSAMNAAAGINGGNNIQAYGYNQNLNYQNGGNQMVSGGGYGSDGMGGQGSSSPQQQYAVALARKQMQQARHPGLQGSPAGSHASLNMNGSPSMAHASPNTANMTPVSPNMQYNQMAMNMGGMQQRPPSRSATGTPQQRPGSAVGVPNMGQGMGSPGGTNGMMQQGSPGRVQASTAR